ncbi:hypothetical protein THICB3100050 [Thiomonas sp. CB3]|nr:hypothetical protein THICB3100050 [Thiomonas sp. CB3]
MSCRKTTCATTSRCGEKRVPPESNRVAHFSDRGRLFQSDRGRRFSVIVDAPGCAQAMGFNVSQSSTIRLKRLSRSGR